MQYTLRNIPKSLDRAMRRQARADGKSLNQVAIEALERGLGLEPSTVRRRDLSDLVGSLSEEDAQAIEQAVTWMDEADLRFQRESGR